VRVVFVGDGSGLRVELFELGAHDDPRWTDPIAALRTGGGTSPYPPAVRTRPRSRVAAAHGGSAEPPEWGPKCNLV
jgi:hypothetical protein